MKKKKKPVSSKKSIGNKGSTVGVASRSADWPRLGRRSSKENEPVAQIAAALKAARESKGLSLTQLARKLDIAPATLIKFEERGHGISISVVASIASVLECELQVKPLKAAAAKKKRR